MEKQRAEVEENIEISQHPSPIRIMIADQDTRFRDRLKEALKRESDMMLVGETSEGNEVPLACGTLNPHVVVMNLYLPRVDGVEVTYRLWKMSPQTKIMILSDHADPYVLETIRSGASGFLLKDTEIRTMVDAIRVIAHGGVYIHPVMMGSLVNELRRLSRMEGTIYYHYRTVPKVSWREVLTEREMEVLRLLAQGKNNRTISEHLYISEKTVKNHVSNILYKLNVQDRTQAVLMAMRYGWVQLI